MQCWVWVLDLWLFVASLLTYCGGGGGGVFAIVDDGALLLDGCMDGGLGHGFLELAAMDILNKSGRREGEGVPRLFVVRRSVETAEVPSLLFFFLSLS